MRTFAVLVTLLTLNSFLFAQDLSKADKSAKKHLEKNIALNKMEVKDPAGTVLHTNRITNLSFKGVSSHFTDLKGVIEEYCIATLYPLKNVTQVAEGGGTVFAYYPEFQAYLDPSDKQLHAMQKLIIPEGSTLVNVYKFNTEKDNGLVLEFFAKSSSTYSYGFILESELVTLMDRVAHKEIGVMTDERDGRTYKWVMIGNQKWFGENLQYVVNEHQSMDLTVRYSNYFGRYYNYSQAKTSCPKGWHLPSDEEWKQMEKEIGVADNLLDEIGMVSRGGDGVSPGTNLAKSHDLMFYAKYSGVVSNKTGIYKLSAHRENAQFWTSSKADEVNAFVRVLGTQFDGVVRNKTGAQNFLSCRCVKDQDLSVVVQNSEQLKEITKKINAQPKNAGNYFDRSIEFFLMGEAKFALNDINKAIELDGSDLEQKLFKAQILWLYSFDKNAAETRQLVDEYINEVKDNDFAYYFASRLSIYDPKNGGLVATYDGERRKKGVELIGKALELDPNNPYYNSFNAKLLAVTGDYAKAVKALNKELTQDPKNGDTHYLLGLMKLKNYHTQNVKNNVKAGEWCTQITGLCFKLTPSQIKDACGSLKKAINYGAEVSPDYLTICSELKQAETLEKHKPIIYTGPRGGRYTINSNGNKCYIPRR